MADSIEDIQSKLASYIDGECSATERAEIVAHLAKNPAHMEMMQELMEQRQLIRRLPREKAPAGLMEDFQGGLERESLLTGTEVLQEPIKLGRRRFAPMLAMAASVALVGGVAAMIYFTKPPKNKQGVAIHNSGPADEREALGDGRSVGDFETRVRGSRESLNRKGAAVDEKVAPGQLFGAVPTDPSTPKPAQPDGPLAAQAEEAETVFITVTSNDLPMANGQVIKYLNDQQIDYTFAGLDGRPTALGTLALHDAMESAAGAFREKPLALRDADRDGNAMNDPRSENKSPAGGGAGVGGFGQGGGGGGDGGGVSPAKADAAAASKVAPAEPTRGAPAPADRPLGEGGVEALHQQQQQSARQQTEPSVAQAGAIDPSDPGQKAAETAGGLLDGARPLPVASRIIVARKMKREQVTHLASALSQPARGQWAAVQRARFLATGAEEGQIGKQDPTDGPTQHGRSKDALALERFATLTQDKAGTTVVADGDFWFFNRATNDLLVRELGRDVIVNAADAPSTDAASADAASGREYRVVALEDVVDEKRLDPDKPQADLPLLRCVIILNEGSPTTALQTAEAASQTPAPTPVPAERPAIERLMVSPTVSGPSTRPATQPAK